jgi:NAD(P)-dependent dehydrogenase (short-subunit alcohol dehydrogenase family)
MKSVIITGTTSGLGQSLLRTLLAENLKLFVLNRQNYVQSPTLNTRMNFIYCDLSQLHFDQDAFPSSVFEDVSEVVFVMNAATILPLSHVVDLDLDDLRTTFNVNFFSYVTLTQSILKKCKERGLALRIILISTGSVVRVISGWSAYSTSKGALLSFCKHVALENDIVEFVEFDPGTFKSKIQDEIALFSTGTNENLLQNSFTDVAEISNRLRALILLGEK